jgi:GTPase
LQRKRKGFNMVSLAGYTNAGKSSLMQRLTGEEVLVEDRMFSTLSTTTKRLNGTNLPILLTDTIGFLDDLPPFVIEAFKNTVTEIFHADLILLLIDLSDDWYEIERKLATSERILFPEVELDRVYLILNKIDRINQNQKNNLLIQMAERWQSSHIYPISALTGEGIDELRDSILMLFSHQLHFELILPQTGKTEAFLTWLRRRVSISNLEYANDVRVVGTCDEVDVKRIKEKADEINGTVVNIEMS